MELETPGRFLRVENNYLTDFYLRSWDMYVSDLICRSHYSIIEMRTKSFLANIGYLFIFYLVLKPNNFLQHQVSFVQVLYTDSIYDFSVSNI